MSYIKAAALGHSFSLVFDSNIAFCILNLFGIATWLDPNDEELSVHN